MAEKYVRGADRLEQRLRLMGRREMRLSISRATRDTSKQIERAVKPQLPKGKTGTLRRSTKVRAVTGSRKYVGTRASIMHPTGPAFYAFYLHMGWHPASHSTFMASKKGDRDTEFNTYRGRARRNLRKKQRDVLRQRRDGDVFVPDVDEAATRNLKVRGKRLWAGKVPGKYWLTNEVRRKRSFYVRNTQRNIIKALRAKGV